MQFKKVSPFLTIALLVLCMPLAGCGGSSPSSSGSSNTKTGNTSTLGQSYRGTTITVLLPPWGALPSSLLTSLKKKTGIKVNLQTLSWDQIHDKIVTASAANVPVADVTEFDWSWVGQFGAAGWYTPLNQYFGSSYVNDTPTTKIFKYHGNVLAMPYTNDFRLVVINTADFRKAGITKWPTTLTQLMADARQIKAKGVVKYPWGEPLSATEGAATPWYVLTKAEGGELFSNSWKPLYSQPNSAGAKALTYIDDAYARYHLIDPAEVAMTDVQTDDAFRAGKSAFEITGPGGLAEMKDPTKSKIVGKFAAILLPGTNGPGATFGLPEALGIPKSSKHVGASVEFIKWWYTPQVMTAMYNMQGDLPTRTSILDSLRKTGKLVDGSVVVAESKHVTPLFLQGTPSWYPQFSGDVATTINQMAKGEKSPQAALQYLGQVGRTIHS